MVCSLLFSCQMNLQRYEHSLSARKALLNLEDKQLGQDNIQLLLFHHQNDFYHSQARGPQCCGEEHRKMSCDTDPQTVNIEEEQNTGSRVELRSSVNGDTDTDRETLQHNSEFEQELDGAVDSLGWGAETTGTGWAREWIASQDNPWDKSVNEAWTPTSKITKQYQSRLPMPKLFEMGSSDGWVMKRPLLNTGSFLHSLDRIHKGIGKMRKYYNVRGHQSQCLGFR